MKPLSAWKGKVLAQGQDDDLIADDGQERVWRSRSSGRISREWLRNGRWEME